MANIKAKCGESVILSKMDPETKEIKHIVVDVGEIIYNLSYVESYEKTVTNSGYDTIEITKTISGVLRKVNKVVYRGLVPESTSPDVCCELSKPNNHTTPTYTKCRSISAETSVGYAGLMVPCNTAEKLIPLAETIVESIDVDISSDYNSKIITIKIDDIRDFGGSDKSEMRDTQVWAMDVTSPKEAEFFSNSKIEVAFWNGKLVDLEQVNFFGNRYKFQIKNLPNMKMENTLLVFGNTGDVTKFNAKAMLVNGYWPSLVKDNILGLPIQFDKFARKWISRVLAKTVPDNMISSNEHYYAVIACDINGEEGIDIRFLIDGTPVVDDWYHMELEVTPGKTTVTDTNPIKLLDNGELQISVPFFFGRVVPYVYTGHKVELDIGGFKYQITSDMIGYYKKASILEASIPTEQGTCDLYQDASGNQIIHVASNPTWVVTPSYRICNVPESCAFINRMYFVETTHIDHTNCENHEIVGKERYRIGISGIEITDEFRNLERLYSDSLAAESDVTRTYDVSCTTVVPAEDVYSDFGMSLVLTGPVDDLENPYRNRWNFVAKKE